MSLTVNSSDPCVISGLPNDALGEIFSHLGSTVFRIAEVCKKWRDLPSKGKELLYKRIFYREFVFFGPEEWKKNFGDPGTVPKINYEQAVKEAFTFASKWPKEWDKKMVWLQTREILQEQLEKQPAHILITPRKIGELVAAKLGGCCDPSGYRYVWDKGFHEHGENSVEESCWVYMTPDVLLGSRGKAYEEQKKQAENFGGEVPELVLAATGILLKGLITRKPLWPYTCCKESAQGLQSAVGGFSVSGLSGSGLAHSRNIVSYHGYGIFVLRKFKAIGA
jgi:F-box associated protein